MKLICQVLCLLLVLLCSTHCAAANEGELSVRDFLSKAPDLPVRLPTEEDFERAEVLAKWLAKNAKDKVEVIEKNITKTKKEVELHVGFDGVAGDFALPLGPLLSMALLAFALAV
ncbi:uncharacterized protein Tco025E_08359 [Trypanosoma conorhini]|uniref:Uncharacterized protein n=1 Tax=Trypanosoma conorhini TaxID=83891 RepID=A0A3R7RH35_9TRYP|nr:uncharacterized protein Tco025E_08359 [Trypanosoma conorhini]RNF02576.1 hypothetical protein Tco025E_08359 [Trypanosoma conorhini]